MYADPDLSRRSTLRCHRGCSLSVAMRKSPQVAEAIGNQSAARLTRKASGVEPDYLGGRPGQAVFDGTWPDHWARTWGARGLRHVWVEEAADRRYCRSGRRGVATRRDVPQGCGVA